MDGVFNVEGCVMTMCPSKQPRENLYIQELQTLHLQDPSGLALPGLAHRPVARISLSGWPIDNLVCVCVTGMAAPGRFCQDLTNIRPDLAAANFQATLNQL